MSNANNVAMTFVAEVTPGVTPASALTDFNFLSDTLIQNTSVQESKTIRSDNQIPNITRVSTEPGGTINFNLQYGSQDPFLAAALRSTWAADLSLSVQGIIVASSKQFTSTGSLTSIVPGQWVKISGFTNPANNGFFKVLSNTAGSPSVLVLQDNGATLVNETVASGIKVDGSQLFNGILYQSFSLEKQFTDVTLFDSFSGMIPGKYTLNAKTGAPIDASFDFMGTGAALSQTVTIGTGGVIAPVSNQELETVDHVKWIRINGVISTEFLSEFTLQTDSTLRARRAISYLAPFSIGLGVLKVTGKFSAYFDGRALLNIARNHTLCEIAIMFQDTAGNAYIYDMEACYLDAGDPTVSGSDTDVIPSYNFMAQYAAPGLSANTVSGKTIGVTRFTAAD